MTYTGNFQPEIVKIYETAVTNEPYEEGLHISFLEALVKLKQIKNAPLSHYNYITGRMYREFSIEPTPASQSSTCRKTYTKKARKYSRL